MPSTQHTQVCVFIKNKCNCAKLVLFYLRLLEIDDREPSEQLGSQIQEQV